jgi:DNA-binding LytR/AlgR family response regulator
MQLRGSAAPANPQISALIVDDEALARDELAFLLKDYPDIEISATASDGLEAMRLISDLEPDVVFLDVQMPGLDGVGVIRQLREKKIPLPHFVLATAYDHYAVEAFHLEAFDYILKPVEKERLAETIERARRAVAALRGSGNGACGGAARRGAAEQGAGTAGQPEPDRRRGGRGVRDDRRRVDHGGDDGV